MRRLDALVPRNGPRHVLEFGFGSGIMLRGFLDRGDVVTGVDLDLLEIEIDSLVRAEGTLIAASAEAVELTRDTYDLAYAIHVIEHLDEPARVFAKVFRALKPGGFAFFLTPNADSRGLRVFRESWWNLEDPTHVRFFSPASISRMLSDAGFRQIEVRRSRWDSLSLEGSSLVRSVYRRKLERGVLSLRSGQVAALASMPVAAIMRVSVPSIAPSIEVIARKPFEQRC